MSNSPTSILVLLRAREGEDLADLLPFAQPGAHVGLGRGVAVIGQAVGLGRAMDQTIAPFVTSLHQRISTTENDLGSGTGVAPEQHQSEASAPLAQGADDPAALLSMLSRLEAETASLREALTIADQKAMEAAPIATRGAGPGGDLLLVLERLVREVIQREAVCGGVIARAIAEGQP